jgi:hypothetical protein
LPGGIEQNPDLLNLQDQLVRQSTGAAPGFITEQEAKDAFREAHRVDVLSLAEALRISWCMRPWKQLLRRSQDNTKAKLTDKAWTRPSYA